MKIHKEFFIRQLEIFLNDIESNNVKFESLEWYLINNLKKYLASIKIAESSDEIKRATLIFSRFATESMDWDTLLYKRCTDITAQGIKLSRLNMQDE